MELFEQTAASLAADIKSKKVSAKEVTDALLARIDAHDKNIGAFTCIDAEGARAQAAEIDSRIAKGESVGALAGVPVAIKDNIHVTGMPTTCSSKIMKPFVPPYDAFVTKKMREAGAVFLGKTNLDEFAMGSSTENSALQITHNPHDFERVPGGSSGGSAAAVAAGFSPLALGSDTGGSIRAPASFCGCVGLKPTYGVVSRYGLVAFGSSLDQIGPFGRTVEDTALLLSVIAGHDPKDSTSRAEPVDGLNAPLNPSAKGLKIGLPKEYFETDGLSDEVRNSVLAAVDALKSEGAQVQEVSLPMIKYAVPTYYIVATAEASSNLARYDGVHYGSRAEGTDNIIDLFSKTREEGFGPEVKRRIMLGTYVLSAGYYDAYYLRALKVRTRIAQDFDKAFEQVDVIASPVAPDTAFKLGELINDPLAMYLSDIYTISTNLASVPGISVPCGTDSKGMPVGLQLMGRRFEDARLLSTAAAYERLSGWNGKIASL